MSDQYVHPWQDPAVPADSADGGQPPVVEAEHAWIVGYEPGNPWQAKLCLRTPHGTVAYPLTPHTMPDLLEGLVVVAQEQQGVTGADALYATEAEDDLDAELPEEGQEQDPGAHNGRAARLTGWTVVHDLWEREDPRIRLIMGAIVLAVFVLGIFLS
ncbi:MULTISPECIES: hypothetical protein [unclassified Streptomyces]|uniref:hypothetical protein n=1 Tax=unclassified Streptomyces TaxID=2593676 RepID=UPI002253FF08|nr:MULTISPECIES: hypothetical protein [unclassified Streptomyces]MCX4527031.1 hypothetical protein [Streptomyces sp. NBC_01551]MCX4542409.1 hypothetical protein [Streptomyces sp. NBC_01565]